MTQTWFVLKVLGEYLAKLALIIIVLTVVFLVVYLVYLGLHGLLSLMPSWTVEDSDGITAADFVAFIASPFVTLGAFIGLICAMDEGEKKYKEFLKREKENAK